jgi:hypothetical protein
MNHSIHNSINTQELNMLTNICHEAFSATEFNKILLGRHMSQGVKILRFGDTVPETDNFYTLMQLTARQEFVLQIDFRSVIRQRNVLSVSPEYTTLVIKYDCYYILLDDCK